MNTNEERYSVERAKSALSDYQKLYCFTLGQGCFLHVQETVIEVFFWS
jgi:hypothetical protein